MAVDKEYWNIPKASDDFLLAQGTNLTVFVDHADNSLVWGLGTSDVISLFLSAIGIAIGFFAYKAANKASDAAEAANSLAKKVADSNKEHNSLSIRPILDSILYSNRGEKGAIKPLKTFKFLIKNQGVGPAVVTNAYLTIDGKKIYERKKTYSNGTDDIRNLIAEALAIPNESHIEVDVMSEQFCIRSGETLTALLFRLDDATGSDLSNAVNKIEFHLEYSDIYNVNQGRIDMPDKDLDTVIIKN
jgi:hypothetical protein